MPLPCLTVKSICLGRKASPCRCLIFWTLLWPNSSTLVASDLRIVTHSVDPLRCLLQSPTWPSDDVAWAGEWVTAMQSSSMKSALDCVLWDLDAHALLQVLLHIINCVLAIFLHVRVIFHAVLDGVLGGLPVLLWFATTPVWRYLWTIQQIQMVQRINFLWYVCFDDILNGRNRSPKFLEMTWYPFLSFMSSSIVMALANESNSALLTVMTLWWLYDPSRYL